MDAKQVAGVAGRPQASNINGCDGAEAEKSPAETAGNPSECRTSPSVFVVPGRTTFPFLKVSKTYGVPYGDVLRHAEWFEESCRSRRATRVPVPVFRPQSGPDIATRCAVLDEDSRREIARTAP